MGRRTRWLYGGILVALLFTWGLRLVAQVPFNGPFGPQELPYATSASPTFTGVASFADGTSCSAPAISNTGDLDTGLAFDTANQVNVCAGGTSAIVATATSATFPGSVSALTHVVGSGADITTFSEAANDATLGDFAWANTYLATGSSNGICVSPSATPTGITCENTMSVGGYFMTSDTDLNWTNSATNSASGTVDTNISRISSTVIGVGSGSAGDVSGGVKASTFSSMISGNIEATIISTGGIGYDLVASDGIIGATSSATNAAAGCDTALSRVSAGVWGVGAACTAGSVTGALQGSSYLSTAGGTAGAFLSSGGGGLLLGSAKQVWWTDNTAGNAGTADTSLFRVGAGALGVGTTGGTTPIGRLYLGGLTDATATNQYGTGGAATMRSSWYEWTNAQVAALGASLTGDIKIATLPAKTVVTNAFMAVKTACGGTATLLAAVGRTGATYLDYIGCTSGTVGCNVQATAGTYYGDVLTERGANLATMGAVDMPSYTATTDIYVHFVSTVNNLNAVTTCTGAVFLEFLAP